MIQPVYSVLHLVFGELEGFVWVFAEGNRGDLSFVQILQLHLLHWLPSCWIPATLAFIIFPGWKKNMYAWLPLPRSWGHHGGTIREGTVPRPVSARWLERCEESSSILFVREIPLAFCVRAGFTGNRSLMKTFLAQHFSHLQAMVTGTV